MMALQTLVNIFEVWPGGQSEEMAAGVPQKL